MIAKLERTPQTTPQNKDLTQNSHTKWEQQQTMDNMDESSQDYSWIQDFEADFPWKVSLKMLN